MLYWFVKWNLETRDSGDGDSEPAKKRLLGKQYSCPFAREPDLLERIPRCNFPVGSSHTVFPQAVFA